MPEPEPETLAKPGGFVPPPTEPLPRPEPEASDRPIAKPAPSEPDRGGDRKGGKRKGGGAGKRTEPATSSGGGFKAVGD